MIIKAVDLFVKLVGLIKEADKRFGFVKVISYTTYILLVIAAFNWKYIVREVSSYMKEVETNLHSDNLQVRENIGNEVHPYLVELRAKVGSDRVMLFEFHNSINNLIGMSFKYITMTDHAEAYGSRFQPKYSDVNSEIIGTFVRNIKVTMFEKYSDLDELRRYDPAVPDVLNNPQAVSACYQYMSVLGRPLGILVFEWHGDNTPKTEAEWVNIRSKCSQAAQDLNDIILKYNK